MLNSTRAKSLAMVIAALLLPACHKKQPGGPAALPPSAESIEDRWKDAALKVEEDRNEPVGARATVKVPDELKHYYDPHRFLEIQAAEWRKQGFEIPRDLPDLIGMIRQGSLVEMDPVGDDYVLFGVGGIAGDGPVTHYDRDSRESIPLFAADAEFADEDLRLAGEIERLRHEIAGLKKQFAAAKGRARSARRGLRARVAADQASVDSIARRKTVIDSFYTNPKLRQTLAAEYVAVATLASDFGGKSYDLADPAARRDFKIRLLSFVRPQARAVIDEIASAYRSKFDRPLPVTSLLRTEEYQHDLSLKNPSAARNAVPPHTTGLAFDVYYHFMTASEQDFLMTQIAALKDRGKVEALRETRDHFHIFAFADGKPPSEELISASASLSTYEGPRPRRKRQTGRRSG